MDSRVRAIDLKTGNVLWKALVDSPAVALPAIYAYKGKQYVVFVAGGNGILTPQVRPGGGLRAAELTAPRGPPAPALFTLAGGKRQKRRPDLWRIEKWAIASPSSAPRATWAGKC